jgi:hypothetical protein
LWWRREKKKRSRQIEEDRRPECSLPACSTVSIQISELGGDERLARGGEGAAQSG